MSAKRPTSESQLKDVAMRERMSEGHQAPHIAFVRARWHGEIVDNAYHSFLERFEQLMGGGDVGSFEVPGAFEIPLLARDLASSGRYDAIVAAAFVVNGGIYRHEFVASVVVDALMRAQLDTGVPILSVVLTPHHFQETAAHRDFFLDHFKVKGHEAAEACVQLLATRSRLAAAV